MFDKAIDDRLADVPANPETGLFDPLPTRAADALTELAGANGGEGRSSDVMVFADFDALTTETNGKATLDSTHRSRMRSRNGSVAMPPFRPSSGKVGK